MLWETVKLALSSIRRNKLRSVLTLLGIVIGVAAVIAMVTLGSGASDKVRENLSKLGSNMLIARPGQSTFGPGGVADSRAFDERDVAALKANLTGIRGVAPTAQKQVKAVYGALNYDTSVTGTNTDWFTVQDWTIADGRAFSEGEIRSGTSVCVIGDTITRELFGAQDPLGERLRLGNFSCEVIGRMAPKGQSAFGTDQDSIVVLPLRTYHRRIAGNTRISTISISVTRAEDIQKVQRDAEDVLRERRRIVPGEEDDFTIRDMTQIMNTMASTTAVLTGLLGAVAAVSLLVGGIGIMNIMLVSVTERTREIGILLGLGLAAGGSALMDVPFSADPKVVALAFAVSALIGVIFGFFPARRAARLDPIEALRHQ